MQHRRECRWCACRGRYAEHCRWKCRPVHLDAVQHGRRNDQDEQHDPEGRAGPDQLSARGAWSVQRSTVGGEKAGKVTVGVVGGQHGDFAPLVSAGYMDDVSALVQRLSDRNFPPKILELSKFNTDKNYYVPWAQATYVLAINKKALQYLPAGADVNALTYDQLKTVGRQTSPDANRPAQDWFPRRSEGPVRALLRRVSVSVVHRFERCGRLQEPRSGEQCGLGSATCWKTAVSPQSTSYDFMQEPLLSQEVWIAWDHTARSINAATSAARRLHSGARTSRSKGPRLHAGHRPGHSQGRAHRASSEKLIEFLTQPQTQINTADAAGILSCHWRPDSD